MQRDSDGVLVCGPQHVVKTNRAVSRIPARVGRSCEHHSQGPRRMHFGGRLAYDQLDIRRRLGIASDEQVIDHSGQRTGDDNRPKDTRGFRITTAGDKATFLSDVQASSRFGSKGDSSKAALRILSRIQSASEQAVSELGGNATRVRAIERTDVGPFTGITTRARVTGKGATT